MPKRTLFAALGIALLSLPLWAPDASDRILSLLPFSHGPQIVGSQARSNVAASAAALKGDCIADDTAALQALVDSGRGATVSIPAGCFKITNTIMIPPDTDVFGQGQNTMIKLILPQGSPAVAMLDLEGYGSGRKNTRTQTISSLSLDGGDNVSHLTRPTKYDGCAIASDPECSVCNIGIGTGIAIQRSEVAVDNIWISNIWNNGIFVFQCVDSGSQFGVSLGAQVWNVYISNVHCTKVGLGLEGGDGGGCVDNGTGSYVYISDSEDHGSGTGFISDFSENRSIMTNLKSYDSKYDGFWIGYWAEIKNIYSYNAGRNGMWLASTVPYGGVEVDGFYAENPQDAGMWIMADGATIQNSTVKGANQSKGKWGSYDVGGYGGIGFYNRPTDPVVDISISNSPGDQQMNFAPGVLTLTQGQKWRSTNRLNLILQTDGDLVYSVDGKAVWRSGTAGRCSASTSCKALYQTDGNLVIQNGTSLVWELGSKGSTALIVSDQAPYVKVLGLPTPAAPTGLSATCNPEGTSVTFGWSATPGATIYYDVQLNNTKNDTPSCEDGWLCAGSDDAMVGNLPATSWTHAVVPGNSYDWWVNATNASGDSAPTHAAVTCAFAADGSSITPTSGGVVRSRFGSWSFGSEIKTDGNTILLNGASVGAGNLIVVAEKGSVFTRTISNKWYQWSGSNLQLLSYSPDGSTLKPGTGTYLVTSNGIWSFGTETSSGGTSIILNGKKAANGVGTLLLFKNNFIYTVNSYGGWYIWNGTGWSTTSNPVPVSAYFYPGSSPTITAGGQVMLIWSATNATTCTSSPMFTYVTPMTTRDATGGQATVKPTTTTTYTLTCSGTGGSVAKTVTITVTPAVKPAPPTGLTSSCSADLKSATVRWDPTFGATSYNIRLNNLANDKSTCQNGWLCSGTDDVSKDGITTTQWTFTVVPGVTYDWWVHAVNTAGGSNPTHASLTCKSVAYAPDGEAAKLVVYPGDPRTGAMATPQKQIASVWEALQQAFVRTFGW